MRDGEPFGWGLESWVEVVQEENGEEHSRRGKHAKEVCVQSSLAELELWFLGFPPKLELAVRAICMKFGRGSKHSSVCAQTEVETLVLTGRPVLFLSILV